MPIEREQFYFPRDVEWREWLSQNHESHPNGIDLIFFKVDSAQPSMRWEEAVRVALCYGWIDSTVRSLGNGKRKQYFTRRNPKSTWSKLNKTHIEELEQQGLIHESGQKMIDLAKKTGTWTAMDNVENGIIPKDLQTAFTRAKSAHSNYLAFAPGYQKSYLSWLYSAKREVTRQKRIEEIISCFEANIKSRDQGWGKMSKK